MKIRKLCLSVIFCAVSLVLAGAETLLVTEFDAKDSTAILQKALDSGAKTVVIEKRSTPWFTRPLFLRSNQTLVLKDGVILRSAPGEYKDLGDCLLNVNDVQNVTVRGEGSAMVVMDIKDYQNPKLYKYSEWRHAISLRGSTNVKVENLTVKNSGGDGVYIASGRKMGYCKNVTLQNIKCIGHHRQGLSVISCSGLLVRDSLFASTSGTSPMAGIDFEPNRASERLENCVVENCKLIDNSGYGLLCHLNPLTAKSVPISLTFRNLEISGNKLGGIVIDSCAGMSQVKGSITIENCRVTDNQTGQFIVRNQRTDGFALKADKMELNGVNPVKLISEAPVTLGGITLNNIKTAAPKAAAVTLESTAPGVSVAGNIQTADGAINMASWSKEQKADSAISLFKPLILSAKALVPSGRAEAVKPMDKAYRFREKPQFWQYAASGEKITVNIIYCQVGKTPRVVRAELFSPSGKRLKQYQIVKDTQVKFTAAETGFYQIRCNTAGMAVVFASSHPNQGVAGGSLDMFGLRRKLYFEVPAGLETVQLRLNGHTGEQVSVKIFNHRGQQMGELKNVTLAKVFRHTRVFAERSEIWCLDFTEMREDASIQLGAGLNPLLASSPEALPKYENR